MRHSIKCETKYSYEQLLALYNEGAKSIGQYNNKELTENSKAKEITKLREMSEDSVHIDVECPLTIRLDSAKAYKEAKTRALTLANETWNSNTAKHSCKNFLVTLIRLAGTRMTGLLEVN